MSMFEVMSWFYIGTRGVHKVLRNVWRVLKCARPKDVTLWSTGTFQWRITFLIAWLNFKMPSFRPISWSLHLYSLGSSTWKSSRFANSLKAFFRPAITLQSFWSPWNENFNTYLLYISRFISISARKYVSTRVLRSYSLLQLIIALLHRWIASIQLFVTKNYWKTQNEIWYALMMPMVFFVGILMPNILT